MRRSVYQHEKQLIAPRLVKKREELSKKLADLERENIQKYGFIQASTEINQSTTMRNLAEEIKIIAQYIHS